MWWVFVLQSEDRRFSSMSRKGPYYIGYATCPSKSLTAINTPYKVSLLSNYRPWMPRALFGPLSEGQSKALAGELRLAKKRSKNTDWFQDGVGHPWVSNPSLLPSQF